MKLDTAASFAAVRDMPVIIKRITSNDAGAVQVVLETQTEGRDLEDIKRLLDLQTGAALLALTPAQQSLPL